jgi:hypothetical protein
VGAPRLRIEARCAAGSCSRNGVAAIHIKNVDVRVRDDVAPVLSAATREHVTGVLAERRATKDDRIATARALQQLVGDRALLLSGARVPAVTTLRPYWQ